MFVTIENYFLVKIFPLFPIFQHQEEELSQARDELNKLREDETKLEREVGNNDLIKWGKLLSCFLSLLFLFFLFSSLCQKVLSSSLFYKFVYKLLFLKRK